MDKLREAAMAALDALSHFVDDYQSEDGLDSMKHYAKRHTAAIAGLRAALADQAPTRVPLTDEQIDDLADAFKSQYLHGGTTFDEFDHYGFARAIERKHGIGAAP